MKTGINRSLNMLATGLIIMGLFFAYNESLSYRTRYSFEVITTVSLGGGIIVSAILLLLSEFLNIDKHWKYISQISVSYLLSFFLVKSSLNFFKGLNYRFSFGRLGQKVNDLEASELFNIAMSHATVYKQFLACSMVFFALMLIFRRTRALGSIGAFAICANIIAISSGFKYNYQLKGWLLFNMSLFLLLSQWKFFLNTLFLNKRFKKRKYPFATQRKLYDSINLFKITCFVGTIIFFHFNIEENWYRNNRTVENPIVGVWKIEPSDVIQDDAETSKFLNAKALYFDQGVYGFIEHQDTLTRFKYHIDAEADQFDMYDFHEFRRIDIKGKFTLLDENTIEFTGKNNNTPLKIKLSRDKRYERFRDFMPEEN